MSKLMLRYLTHSRSLACSSRGLHNSAKWAAELAESMIEDLPQDSVQQCTLGQLSSHSTVICNVSFELQNRVEDYLLCYCRVTEGPQIYVIV